MKTYYVTGSNGKVYRVKAENTHITGRYIAIMYHVRVLSVEQAYLARSAILRYVISYMPLYYASSVYTLCFIALSAHYFMVVGCHVLIK